MQYNKRMLKTADHCLSKKSGLVATDIQDKPPRTPFLMPFPLLFLQFLLSTIVQSTRKGHMKKQ